MSEEELTLRRLIDQIHLKYPFMGSRRIRNKLAKLDHNVNRKWINCIMLHIGIRALFPGRKTTKPNKAHKVFPYLLRDLKVSYSNQVWVTDITYIPMAKGFLYIVGSLTSRINDNFQVLKTASSS